MATTADISNGMAIRHNGEIHVILSFQHVSPGKGGAFVRTRLKNIKTGKAIDHTFKSGETIDLIDLDRKKMQYLYSDDNSVYFMDPRDYEQVSISREEAKEALPYLQEGKDITLMLFEGSPIKIEVPIKMVFTVKTSPEGARGDSAQGRVTKDAVLENGIKVQVPLFVNEGDKIVINTETGEYVERAS